VRRIVFSLLLLSALATRADAASSVSDLLLQMQAALQNLNYHGTLVYLHGGQVQSMRIVHQADETGERERLINLNGPGREVVRNNDIVTCYIPEQKVVMVGRRQLAENMLSRLAGNDFQALRGIYDFRLNEAGRVAGRSTRRVDIVPKDSFRYGYRLWLDRKTALLLGSDLVGEGGELLEQAMFAEISIVDQIPPAMLSPVTDSSGFNWYRENTVQKSPAVTDSPWRVGELPAGFAVDGRYRHPLPDSAQPAEHWVITDGLATVSIYIEALPQDKDVFTGASRMGVMNVFGRVIAGHQITVIGDVPRATVERIAAVVSLSAVRPGQ
jgi:sigma-E factor negative regulatory protein RseB